jgi:23S rRNA (uridine2552-2'-O)-methyltransferase
MDKPINKVRNKRQNFRTARGRTVSSTKWLKRHINDPYVNLAKERNYRSRAAFKLIQIDEKFKILRKASSMIDIGCAPGGWLQVARQLCKPDAQIIGVDLQEVQPLPGVTLIKGDFYDDQTTQQISDLLKGKADLIVSDMAAASCGNHEADHLRNMALAEAAFDFAIPNLKTGGCFVAKVLRGGQEGEFLKTLRTYFTLVKSFKPAASYEDSSEFYFVCTGFKPEL